MKSQQSNAGLKIVKMNFEDKPIKTADYPRKITGIRDCKGNCEERGVIGIFSTLDSTGF